MGFIKFKNIWRKYNYILVDYIVSAASTPEAFWIAVIMILTPEFFPNSLPTISFISQNVIQLLFLFLILISGERTYKKTETRDQKDHITLRDALKKIELINKKLERGEKDIISELQNIKENQIPH